MRKLTSTEKWEKSKLYKRIKKTICQVVGHRMNLCNYCLRCQTLQGHR